MKLRLGRKQPFSLEEIEREAAAEIEQRVSMGKPPPEEWKGLAERAGADTPMPGRPTSFTPPPAPPRAEAELDPPAEPAAAAEVTPRPAAKRRPSTPTPKAAAKVRAPAAKAKAAKAPAKAAKAPPKARKASG